MGAALSGFWVATALDASIAGSMATMTGVLFGLAYLFAPYRGLVAQARRRIRQRWDFAEMMLAIHLLNHEGRPESGAESRLDTLHSHLRWNPDFLQKVVRLAERRERIAITNGCLTLTPGGRELARKSMVW